MLNVQFSAWFNCWRTYTKYYKM